MKQNYRPFAFLSALKTSGVLATSLLLFGCPASKPGPENPPPGSPASNPGAGNTVVIRGSNTIGEELAPRLIAEFRKKNSDITFDIETKATGYGLAALRIGQADIAAASRAAIEADLEMAKESGIEMADYVIGAYSVAIVVNANNPVANLTKDQVHGIFTGKIENWKDVGGPDAAIHLYVRDPISGTHLGFKEIALKNDPYAHHPKLLTSYAAIVEAVAADALGIGYTGIGLTHAGSKAITIEGVEASPVTVNSGKYPYVRTLRLYTNKNKESQATKDFIQFVVSAKGQEIISQLGFSPKP
jgi:phosphate transport system substrate-binding protein